MDGLISGKRRTYDDFKLNLSPQVIALYDGLRDYCFSLGKNVVEDIRMHRIVFSKSMSFRNFADIEPQKDHVIIKIKKDRKEPEKEIQVKLNDDLTLVKKMLLEAYTNIR